jgi:gentisate 1,2-dioxygenase
MKFHDKFGFKHCCPGVDADSARSGVTGMIAEPGVRPRSKELNELSARTRAAHLFEFWSQDFEAEHDATNRLQFYTKAQPHIWKYSEISPLLKRSGELIDMYMSERRSLIMVNPALRPNVATVSTMFAAYRINMPNEKAPAHRHSPNAIRFGLTGSTNFTGVEGEDITFGPGDLVLTPHDTWHNHANGGDTDAVNLSVLDMPLVNTLNSTYFDHEYTEDEAGKLARREFQTARFPTDYSKRIYGRGGLMPRNVSHVRGTGNSSPMFVYRWDATKALLDDLHDHDGSPYDGIMVEYVDPVSGCPVYRTMTFFIQLLRAGEALLPQRQNANRIVTILEGRGHSIVGDQRFDWEPFDTFCIPGGEWCHHVNETTGKDAILFISSDEPTLKALGFMLKHGRTASGDTVNLA